MKSEKALLLIAAILSLMPVKTVLAGDKTKLGAVDCATTSLAAEIGKLDRSIANVVEFQGDCVEDVVVEGFRDLKLIGLNGASITATDTAGNGTTALTILRSTVAVDTVTFYGGEFGAKCSDSSDCRFRDITIHGVGGGLALQSQSRADLSGAGTIDGFSVHGLAVYGASSLNVHPNWDLGEDDNEHAATIDGGGTASVGVMVQDGSFFRSDNATITGNKTGVFVHRGAVATLYDYSTFGIEDNINAGVRIEYNSTANIYAPITGNATGLSIGALSSAQIIGGPGGSAGLAKIQGNDVTDVSCAGPLAVSNACP